MGRILKGTPLNYVNPKQIVWVRTTAGDFACTAETEINSSAVTVVIQEDGTAHAFCESAARLNYSRIVRRQRGYPAIVEELVGGVAVLYSVLNAGVREFWVKTAASDVKVYELALDEIPWEPYDLPDGTSTYIPGPGAAAIWTWSLTGLLNPRQSGEEDVYGKAFGEIIGGGNSTCTILGTEPIDNPGSGSQTLAGSTYNFGTGAGGLPGPLVTVDRFLSMGSNDCGPSPRRSTRGSYTYIVNGVQVGAPTSYFGGALNIYNEQRGSLSSEIRAEYADTVPNRFPYEAFSRFDFEYDSTFNSSVSTPGGTITPPTWPTGDTPPSPPDPIPAELPYEAFISAAASRTVFTLIKSDVNSSDELYGELKYQSLIGGALTDLGATADTKDWRGEAVSLNPTAEISASLPCVADYLDATDALLLTGKLHTIDLGQDIGGDTLRTRLQTSPDTVSATLTTRTATSEASCTLGTESTSKINVPSPGRGTIEGITYLP